MVLAISHVTAIQVLPAPTQVACVVYGVPVQVVHCDPSAS